MSFNQFLHKNASIIEAYKKMKEQPQQESCNSEIDESDDSGGDASAYNKYLLAKTGDLPRSKEEYMRTEELLPNKFHADHEHQIKKVAGHKSEFSHKEYEPIEHPEDKKKMSYSYSPKKLEEEKMSPSQMKKREEIVMSMKEKLPEFKKRYGDRAKEVMYAIATKRALEESIGQLLSPAVFKYGSKNYSTYSFQNSNDASEFMRTPQGQSYGYIGMDDQGHFHFARMDDDGVLDK